MILVDTSVWVDHLRADDQALAALLDASAILVHPFVIGELALGNLRHREIVLNALSDLPHASAATDLEVLHFSTVIRCSGAASATLTAICSRQCN